MEIKKIIVIISFILTIAIDFYIGVAYADGQILNSVETTLTGELTFDDTEKKDETTCFRTIPKEPYPFILCSKQAFKFRVTKDKDASSYHGSHFTHSQENPSPHISATHIESAYHVFGGNKYGEKEQLRVVLENNKEYLKPLRGVCIEIEATPLSVKVNDNEWQFEGGEDSYRVRNNLFPEGKESVVTKKSIVSALGKVKQELKSGVDIVFVRFEGGEDYYENWPYFTNDALEYLMEQSNASIIALNTPSIDREKDEGAASNHKVVFNDPNRLIIELADFKKLEPGFLYTVRLNVQLDQNLSDCALCHLVAENMH